MHPRLELPNDHDLQSKSNSTIIISSSLSYIYIVYCQYDIIVFNDYTHDQETDRM